MVFIFSALQYESINPFMSLGGGIYARNDCEEHYAPL